MRILRNVLDDIVAHAQEAYPQECCGVLSTTVDEPSVIGFALRAENAADQNRESRYALGHRAHLEAVKMECAGIARIVGYYHSHPDGGTKASRRDAADAVPGVLYLIVGIRNGHTEHAAWMLEDGNIAEVPLNVIE